LGIYAWNVGLIACGQSEPIILILLEVEILAPLDQIVYFTFKGFFIKLMKLFIIERIVV